MVISSEPVDIFLGITLAFNQFPRFHKAVEITVRQITFMIKNAIYKSGRFSLQRNLSVYIGLKRAPYSEYAVTTLTKGSGYFPITPKIISQIRCSRFYA
ncbi:hypothetical protein AT959_11295 [Dechloromonas denitrificans]|uniref:Uncharacterized protein n=1 Tax=Dechloromonas denitrificans TaxID=281362 RepID=A0A133XGE1_9RHOO|nr:hypothetical protein AT959_11295 [Dechloromonas denitrificans]